MTKILKKILLWAIFIALAMIAAYVSYFTWKLNRTGNKINIDQSGSSLFSTVRDLAASDPLKIRGYENGRINILLLGVAGAGKPGNNLTDSILIASLDTRTNKVALLSVPRDLLVKVPGSDYEGKINSVYQYGINSYGESSERSIEPLEATIKEITSLDMDYWVVMNFDGFQKAVDTIGGINVTNEKDILDTRYPGPNYSYETFSLKSGFQHLDGATALKFARMRHDIEGDFGRAKRQQQVLQAAKNKIFSTGTLLNVSALDDLFNILGDNVKTDIKPVEFGDFLELAKKLDTNNINNVVIDAWNQDSLLVVSHVFYGDVRAFVLVPRIGSWSETQELAQNIFDTNTIKRRRQAISDESAKIALVNKSGSSIVLNRIKSLLTDSFGYKNVTVIPDQNKNTEESTTVYDLTGGTKPFTLDELISKLPGQASYEKNIRYGSLKGASGNDMVVVIGKDLEDKFGMAQDSIEDYNKDSATEDYTEFRSDEKPAKSQEKK